MSIRQQFLKIIYPVLIFLSKLSKKQVLKNLKNTEPLVSFYELSVQLNNGEMLNFSEFKGYKVLLVNTASDCGYTAQYAELEELYRQNKQRLKIVAFPSNNFKQQEKGTDSDVALFCKKNYGISFFLSQKTNVVGNDKNDVFEWLSDKNKNGWCSQQPQWNFSKYLVNEQGVLVAYFATQTSPKSDEFLSFLEAKNEVKIC